MKNVLSISLFSLVVLLSAAQLSAEDYGLPEINEARATYNYQMFCQGCHTPDGSGSGEVPALKDHIGVFLNTQQGREFLVRVPGAATSVLSDEKLAEVLNWIVVEFAGSSLSSPSAFKPYTAEELGPLRAKPLTEIVNYRREVLSRATNG